MIFGFIKNRVLRIIARGAVILMCLIAVVFIAANIYVYTHKDSILNTIKENINNSIAGKFDAKNIEIKNFAHFPNIAVELQKVELTDSVYNKPLLACAEVSLRFSIFKIWDSKHQAAKIVFSNGKINFFKDTSGYNNTSMLAQKNKATGAADKGFLIHAIELENMDLLVNNDRNGKTYDLHINNLTGKIQQKDSILFLTTDENILIRKLVFNPAKGNYLQNNKFEAKLKLTFNKKNKTLACNESKILVNNQPWLLKATFILGEVQTFALDLISKNINYNNAITVLPPKLKKTLSSIQLKQPVFTHVIMNGTLRSGENCLINIECNTSKNEFTSSQVVFEDCSFHAKFTNQLADSLPRTDEFSKISFDDFSGNWRGLLFSGKNIIVTNLVTPNIEFLLATSGTLQQIDNAIGSDNISFLNGSASIILSYNGLLNADPASLKNLDAHFIIKDGLMRYEPKNILLEKCSGELTVGNNNLAFKNFQFDYKSNHFVLNLAGSQIANIAENTNAKSGLSINIFCPYLHVDEIFAILAPSENISKKEKKKRGIATANNIDDMFANNNWNINLKANKISKGAFYAENATASLKMQGNKWTVQNLSFKHAEGVITASGYFDESSGKQAILNADAKIQQVNVKKIFTAFGNFGQSSITADNLKGILTADAKINVSVSNNGKVIPHTNTGFVNFSLLNGEILNHKGLEQMKLLFLKNRDMSDVKFAELKGRLDVTPDYIYINRMEIASSAINMFLEGRYDTYGKNTDMLIQVPFSNLAKQDENYKAKNKGINAKTGASLWIRAKNDNAGDIKFSPTLSKKIDSLKKN